LAIIERTISLGHRTEPKTKWRREHRTYMWRGADYVMQMSNCITVVYKACTMINIFISYCNSMYCR